MMRSRASALACIIPGCSSSSKKRHPSGDSLSYYEAHQDEDDDRHRQQQRFLKGSTPPPQQPSSHQRSSSASTSPEPGLLDSDTSSVSGGSSTQQRKPSSFLQKGNDPGVVHLKLGNSPEPTPPNSPRAMSSFATTSSYRTMPMRSSSASSSHRGRSHCSNNHNSNLSGHRKLHPITPPPLPSKSMLTSRSVSASSSLKRSPDSLFGSSSEHQLVPYVDPCCRSKNDSRGHTRSHSASAMLLPVLVQDEDPHHSSLKYPAATSRRQHRRTKSMSSENSYLSSSSDDDDDEDRIPSPVQSVKSMPRCASPTPRPVTPTGAYYPHPRTSSRSQPSSPYRSTASACPTPPLSPRPYSNHTSLVPYEPPHSPNVASSSSLVLHRRDNSNSSILLPPPSRSSSPARLRAREIVANRQHQKQMVALQQGSNHSNSNNTMSADDRSCVSNLSWSSGNTSFSRLQQRSQLQRQHQLEQQWMTLQERQDDDDLEDQDSLEEDKKRPRQVVLETVTLLRSIKHQIKAMKRRERNLCQHLAVQRGERMVVQERIETLEARRLRVEARFLRPLPLVVLLPVVKQEEPAPPPETKRKQPRRLLSWTRRKRKNQQQLPAAQEETTVVKAVAADEPQEYHVSLVSEGLEWKIGDPIDKIQLPSANKQDESKDQQPRALLIHFGPTATQPMAAAVSCFDPSEAKDSDSQSTTESLTESATNKDSFDEDEMHKDFDVVSTKSTLSSASSHKDAPTKLIQNNIKKENRLAKYLQQTVPQQDARFWERLYMTSAGVVSQQPQQDAALLESSRQAIVDTLQKHAGVWSHDLNQVVDKQTRQVHWVCYNEAQLGIHQYKYYDPVPPPS